jgi:Fe2+ or Zn2+ uptake regulation protein
MTPQRAALLHLFSRVHHHPTADELFRRMRRAHPSVSAATVYRNVQQLVDAGVIARLDRTGVAQYDPNPETHHHFVCDGCGAVVDIYLSRVSYRLDARRSPLKGASVGACELKLRGRCSRCRRVA